MEQLKDLVRSYEVLQETRLKAENQLRALNGIKASRVLEKLRELKSIENTLTYEMKKELQKYDEYNLFLSQVHGVGPTLAAKLMVLELDPSKHLSSWNAFFGLVPKYWIMECEDKHKYAHPRNTKECPVCGKAPVKFQEVIGAPRKQKGVRMFFSTKSKALYYLIGTQFVKSGKFYKRFYYQVKTRKQQQYPDYPAGRLHYQALRSTFKLFLAHYYEVKREVYGLPPEKPYQFEYMEGHDYISYHQVLAFENGEVEDAV